MEAGGDELFARGGWIEIAGELGDGELIEWHIVVEGLDGPISPVPHGSGWITLVAVGVGIAGCLQPFPDHSFSVVGGLKKLIDPFLVPVTGWVAEESVEVFEGGR